jgi:spoIIIJ-associated protein
MYKSVEATGRTIDDAIAKALEELGVDRDSVSVEVLEKPKAGFLGIGSAQAKVKVIYELSKAGKASDFLTGLLSRMNAAARPMVEETTEGTLDIKLEGENLGMLIGRRGETLNAIQHITNYVVNRDEDDRVRVMVDIENYRKKREDSLEKLAEKTATKVMRYKRNVALEPMNAYERHVIHAALQEWKDVSTYSSGAEPRRCVVISYTPNGEKPKYTERSGPVGRPGGDRGGRNDRGGKPRPRPPYQDRSGAVPEKPQIPKDSLSEKVWE